MTAKVLKRTISDWAFPIRILEKAGNNVRIICYFRVLNRKTEPDVYNLPNIQDTSFPLKGAKLFSKLDLSKAFYFIPIAERDQKYFTITTLFGNFSHLTIPLGFLNSPSAFQRFMNVLFADISNVRIYMDDILIVSAGKSEQAVLLQRVLERLAYFKICLNE